MRRLGLLGGTFDPIHHGHLDAAHAAHTTLALDEVLVIPAHDPPHREHDPHTSAFHRFAMVSLAIDGQRWLRASDRELRRSGISYTIDTLRALHAEGVPASQLFFILGGDAFAEIATWRSYPEVLDASNFVVIARPGTTVDAAIARVPALQTRVQRSDAPASNGLTTGIFPVNADTRDVSSTQIRARLAAHERIDDLVPAAVARHILAHHLYGTVDDLHGEDQRITSQGT
jgi:nicotinate-nucleotide adenylyltransferase